MGLIERLFGRKSHYSTVALTDTGQPLYSLLNFGKGTLPDQKAIEAFSKNPLIYNVVNRIASLVASVEWELAREDGKDVTGGVQLQRVAQLLNSPNEIDSWKEMVYKLAVEYLIHGQCFVFSREAEGLRTKVVSSLVAPNNANVTINNDSLETISGYTITYFSKVYFPTPEQVLNIRMPNMAGDTHLGQSPLLALKDVFLSVGYIVENDALIHMNHGVSAIISSKANRPLTAEYQKMVQDALDLDLNSRHRVGKYKYSPVELNVQPLGFNPKDLQSNESLTQMQRIICSVYNVPSQLFGDTAASTYANVKEARRAMWENAVIPLLERLQSELSAWLLQGKLGMAGYKFGYNNESISALNDVNLTLSQKVASEIAAGIITAQEARAMLYPNLPPMVIETTQTTQSNG